MSLIVKTTDIKYTISEYEYEDSFLKNVGNHAAANPTAIAGVVMSDKYRLPPVQLVKEDGKKSWKAKPVEDTVFMAILKNAGIAEGEWIVTNGTPLQSESHIAAITSDKDYRVLNFNVYTTSLGPVALVTEVRSQ
jgi:hypothetical protein